MTQATDRVLSPAELDKLIPEILMVEAWVASVRQRILEELEGGELFDHARLEPKRALRKWKEEPEEVIASLQELLKDLGKDSSIDKVAPRKVVSPAEAEKLVGKGNFAHLAADRVKAESSGNNLKLF